MVHWSTRSATRAAGRPRNIDVNRNFLADDEPLPTNALRRVPSHPQPTGPTFDLDDTSFLTG
jgi:hypothetical protein